MRESIIESHLRDVAIRNGYLCMKFISPSNNGVPDRLLIGHDHTFFVETKAPGGVPRKLQTQVIKRMQKHGAIVFVADTKSKIDTLFEKLRTCNIHDITI